jgi:hypothetical protein
MMNIAGGEHMQKWKLQSFFASIGTFGSVDDIFTKKRKKDDKTDWEQIQKLANEGWELVCVTPHTYGGTTVGYLYTFKKLISE